MLQIDTCDSDIIREIFPVVHIIENPSVKFLFCLKFYLPDLYLCVVITYPLFFDLYELYLLVFLNKFM